MASVRIRGISAKVDDKKVIQIAKKIRDALGEDYRIIIDKNRISVEGDIQDPKVRKKIKAILAS